MYYCYSLKMLTNVRTNFLGVSLTERNIDKVENIEFE